MNRFHVSLLPFLYALTLVAGTAAAKQAKVEVCQATGNGGVHLIEVSENALDAHLGHGDWLPLDFFADGDGDGFGDPADAIEDCVAPTGYVEDATDCDDADPDVNPAAAEVAYDGLDNDCDGLTPDDDLDGDGADIADDCDDGDDRVHPGAEETCDDGVDQDCDGEVDEDCLGECGYFYPADGDDAEPFAPTPYDYISDSGTLVLCAGDFSFTQLTTTDSDVTIVGAGSDATFIHGRILARGGDVHIEGVSVDVEYDWSAVGGQRWNRPLNLTLERVVLENSYRGLDVLGSADDTSLVHVTLDDVIVRNNGSSATSALKLWYCESTMANVLVEGNISRQQSSTVRFRGGIHEMTDSTLQGNLPSGYAVGVVSVLGADVTMTRCDVAANDLVTTYASSQVFGVSSGGALDLRDCSVTGNRMDWSEDGIALPAVIRLHWNASNTISVRDTEFTDNRDVHGTDMNSVHSWGNRVYTPIEGLGSAFTCDSFDGCTPLP